jgi:hypothetical protein
MSPPTTTWSSTCSTAWTSRCSSPGQDSLSLPFHRPPCIFLTQFYVKSTRNGIQQRKNCWQDGVLGTDCPIPPGWNWTYSFQVKDQIGSFFYFPPLTMQRAAGGFGGITVNNRAVISVPFDTPDGDITLLIGDWYKSNHTVRRNYRRMLALHGFSNDPGADCVFPCVV